MFSYSSPLQNCKWNVKLEPSKNENPILENTIFLGSIRQISGEYIMYTPQQK